MNDSLDDEPVERKFPVTSIAKTQPPSGADGGEWYEYVIGNGASAIKGVRRGTLKSVTQYAEEYADNLDRRAAFGYSAYAARKPTR